MKMEIDIFVNILEAIGTVAFASSGALTAVQCGMDLFGINVLALVTAAGGGVVRDIIIGRLPPAMFFSPLCIFLSFITASFIFVILKAECRKNDMSRFADIYEKTMSVLDTVGLAVFTVTGINAGIDLGYENELFLLVFSGVITGVGGGVLRDILADKKPFILVSQVYASATVIGAMIFLPVYRYFGFIAAGIACFITVVLIRSFAVCFRWNLPHISDNNFKNIKGE